MRNALSYALVLTVVVFVLTACGGSSEPTPTPEQPTTAVEATSEPQQAETPVPDTTSESILNEAFGEGLATNPPSIADITPEAIIVAPLPTIEDALPIAVGTLITSPTEDPEAGVPFNWVQLYRKGGPPNPDGTQAEMLVTIYADGRIVRDGATGQVAPGVIDLLNLRIREMNFFGAQSLFMGPLGADDITTFLYTVTVSRGDQEKAINGMDGYIAPEFNEIIALMILEAQKLPN